MALSSRRRQEVKKVKKKCQPLKEAFLSNSASSKYGISLKQKNTTIDLNNEFFCRPCHLNNEKYWQSLRRQGDSVSTWLQFLDSMTT